MKTRARKYAELSGWAGGLLFCLVLCGCPFKLVTGDGASLPAGIKAVSVPLARNLTIEAGLEDLFTQALRKKLIADGRVQVTDQAEARLACDLSDLAVSPASYTEQGKIASETISISARCRLVMAHTQSVAWDGGRLVSGEEYPVGPDYLMNERARETALIQVAEDLAESVRSLLLDSAW